MTLSGGLFSNIAIITSYEGMEDKTGYYGKIVAIRKRNEDVNFAKVIRNQKTRKSEQSTTKNLSEK